MKEITQYLSEDTSVYATALAAAKADYQHAVSVVAGASGAIRAAVAQITTLCARDCRAGTAERRNSILGGGHYESSSLLCQRQRVGDGLSG